MVASVTVSMAIAAPALRAFASSPSMRARAMPRRRWVGETVTALTAQASTLRPPGTLSPVGQPSTVATGTSGCAAVES